MPTYTFENTEDGDIYELTMTIAEYMEFKEDNPHLKQLITGAPSIVSGTGGIKNDSGWKENLSRIAEAHPTSALADRVGGRKIKDVKTQEALKKHTSVIKGGTNYNLDKVK